MRFELHLILNILGQLLAVCLPVLMENDPDGVIKACATKISIPQRIISFVSAKKAFDFLGQL
jgi:hypothetical protein